MRIRPWQSSHRNIANTANVRPRAPRNRTLVLSDADRRRCSQAFAKLTGPWSLADVLDATICQDVFAVLPLLPSGVFDLVVADPPYNLTKAFNGGTFKQSDARRLRGVARLVDPRGPPVVEILRLASTSAATGVPRPRSTACCFAISWSEIESPGNERRAGGRRRTGKTTARTSGSPRFRMTTRSTSTP